MNTLDLLRLNLVTPMTLCFALGVIARLVKSDLKLPTGAYSMLAIYLLLAIGLKGGAAIAKSPASELLMPVTGAIILGSLIPLAVFAVSRKVGRLETVDCAALAAHYGSVSAVTFIACLAFLTELKASVEGFAPALVTVMEVPGIVVGLLLAKRASGSGLKGALQEIVTGKSIILMAGGLVIGILTGPLGYASVEPFFVQPFKGALCIFLLDMGLMAASRLAEIRNSGWFVAALGIIGPIVLGVTGALVGRLCGLSVGGCTVLATLSASASYIAAPAAVRIALPEANPSIYLGAAVGVTFPFNLAFGIPLYYSVASMLAK
jgi:hypothetical protein